MRGSFLLPLLALVAAAPSCAAEPPRVAPAPPRVAPAASPTSPADAPAADMAAAVKAAEPVARAWLALVDAGDYDASLASAATLFRAAVTPQQWSTAMASTRAPLGAVLSRELASGTYATSLPGAPDGQYVVFQFKSSFANKQAAVETVTPMLDTDGTWRVSGYYIK